MNMISWRAIALIAGVVCLFVCGLWSSAARSAGAMQTREVRVVGAGSTAGSTVGVPIELVSLGNENAIGFSLNFNPAVLSSPVVALGTGASGATLNVNANEAASGRVGIALAFSSGLTFAAGTRQMVLVTFAIAGNAPAGTTPITFGNAPVAQEISDVTANILTAAYTPGTVTIQQANPAPTLSSLSPNAALAGSGTFTLSVTGTNFVNTSAIRWNGSPRTTTFVSGTQLTALIPATDVATAGTASVSVQNPAPGGGISNAQTFTINNPVPAVTSVSPNSAIAGAAAQTVTINGTGFVAGSKVQWNGADRATTFVSAGGRQRRAGFFAQDIFQITSRLTMTLSGRYDNWRDSSAASVSRSLTTGLVTPTFFPTRSEEAFSPRLNLSYAVRPQVTLRAAAYRAFRAPTLNELYRSFRVGDTQTLANAALTAERLTGGELGATFTPARNVTGRLTAFWTETNNPIANFTLSVTPALITRERRNLGRTRARGLEAEADFVLNDHWRLTAGYLFVDAVVRRAPQDASLIGRVLPQVARHQFTLQTSWAHPKWVTAAIQFRATGRQFDDDQNRLPLGSFAVIDASLSRAVYRNVELFFSAQNLLDDRFVVARTPIENVGMPRMIRGGLRFRWER